MPNPILLGNLCSLLAACFTLLSAWSRDYKRIYLCQAAQCLVMAGANVFFASLSGVTTFALCALRNLLVAYGRFTPGACAFFVAAVAGLGLAANNRGAVGLLPVATTVLYTVGCLRWKTVRGARKNLIVNLGLWAVYDALILDLVSCAVDAASALTALARLKRDE